MLKRFLRSIRISMSMFLNHLKKELQCSCSSSLVRWPLNSSISATPLSAWSLTTLLLYMLSLTYGKGRLTGGGVWLDGMCRLGGRVVLNNNNNNNNNTSICKAHNVSIRAESETPKVYVYVKLYTIRFFCCHPLMLLWAI